MTKTHPFHGKLPGEDNSVCCWFVPLNVGLYVIGIFCVIYGIWAVRVIIDNFSSIRYTTLLGILWLISCLPLIVSMIYFIQFFINPNKKGRLATACMLVVFSCLAGAAISLVYPLIHDYPISFILNQIVPPAITSLFFFYFAGVCKRAA